MQRERKQRSKPEEVKNMESEKVGRENFGGYIQVQNVQALASKGLKKNIPPQYIRPELEFDEISIDESQSIPVIDLSKLTTIEESMKLHHACKDWGFFQLINHGATKVVEEMKVVSEEFFELPQEEKMDYAQLEGDIEGYGQVNVFSEDQKLDWGDMLLVMTSPVPVRNMRFWPTSPTSFRSVLDAYAFAMDKIEKKLLRVIAKNLGVDPTYFVAEFKSGLQAVRINYYPPCDLANKVIGFTPHSDASGLTLLTQVNDVQGLQIKKNDKWIPVEPLPCAIVVNIGDIIEIMSNGEYRSIEHRAVVNTNKARMSIASFHNLNMNTMVGPIPYLLTGKNEIAKYKTMSHEDYVKMFTSKKLDGKSLLEEMRST